ncbi:probable NOT transcription complex subunit VIP2 [Primulina huaijiensis]|uniref:probable NOT transcription complex subunit VIP2 n=1 Tax=Primulina huaijiensis TaxID=1492673 RepID=UPI003CC731EC
MVNSIGGFVSADGSGSSSTGLANVPSPVSGLNLSAISAFPATSTSTRLYNPSRGKEVAQSSRLGPDDYGLLGLLKIIKGANPAKTSLAMGVDPHSLGLDLNSLEPLNQKFASPWSDEPVKEGPKYNIPDCYNTEQPPPLKLSHFKKFHLAMLFYIFYSMPQDQAQLFAANELHDRGWYFHRELHMWFSRDKNSVPTVKNENYEVGCYVCFDPSTWQTIRQENVVLYYKMIEQRPAIPP